ncbi:uncharacterized protein LOC130711254 [Lotus japonicus]|uniref:uncharacterized protein LOC130711254 n=1 Tax=Lotus japonicus TaxID=34305 RepID=UPI00258713C0|nr:uncharacterized protein LOC130711254 [Lotus japonicus]
MSGAGDVDDDAMLSDVEDDTAADPIPPPSPENISEEKLREILTELDQERKARLAAENSKSELQVSFNRLKALAHEAIKKRDEFGRQRDDAVKEKEEVAKQVEEVVKERDALRSEIGNSSHMLVTGMEKISAKVNGFSGGALPRSQKYTGMAAVVYGVIKRANEIVEELLRQNDATGKARDQAREQIEQRNYEIAIEVSQLEATISDLRDEVAKKDSAIEGLEKDLGVRDLKLSEVSESLRKEQGEVMQLKDHVGEYEVKFSKLESQMESLRPMLIDQLSFVSKIHNQICNVVRALTIDDELGNLELSESLFVPQETDIEENVRASLAGMESIHELTWIVVQKARDVVEEKNREIKSLDETVNRLVTEKDQIGSLLRSALSKRMASDPSSRKNELFLAAENGLKDAGIDFKFSKLLGDGKLATSNDKEEEDEIYSLAGALEDVVKTSQLEIIELKHTVDQLRAELSLLKLHIEAQTKELDQRMHRIEELEEKERVANENIEGLMMDIAAAEEEINRWKDAAEQEAAAGRGVEQEFVAQLSTLKHELEEAKQAMLESEKKLKFKEETAAAAMAARDAAEKSLRLADTRSSRLRDRVEELTHQLEEFENREDSRGGNRPRYVCWPWQWLGMDFVGYQPRRLDTQQEASNEMELSEPLL